MLMPTRPTFQLAALCVVLPAMWGCASATGAPPATDRRPSASTDAFPAAPADRLPTAVTLRRIAEAVDGHRTGRAVWVVADLVDAPGVAAVVESRDSAEAIVRSAGEPKPSIYGPFGTRADSLLPMPPRGPDHRPIIISPGGCYHVTSSAYSPRSMCAPPGPGAIVVGVTLTFETTGGPPQSVRLPRDVDAIFLGMSAVDKFVIPYYTHVLGVEAAAAMRRTMLSGTP